MASIQKRGDNFRVQIRKEGFINIEKTFSNEEDAILYSKWKEDIMQNIANFEVPKEELITLDTAIDMKIEEGIKAGLDKRTMASLNNLKSIFSKLLKNSIHELGYEDYLKIAKELMVTEVRKGGSNSGGGDYRLPSKETVINRFKYLGTVYGHLIKKGFSVINHPLTVVNFLNNQK